MAPPNAKKGTLATPATRRSAALVASAILASAGAVSCRTAEPTSPSVGLTQAVVSRPLPDEGTYPDREITIHVFTTENLRSHCSGPAPFFRYDSDRITPQDQPGLAVLAECMKTGPLHDKRVLLMGRTDARGGDDKNMSLGLARAESVKKFLVDHGVSTDRVVTITLGKVGADPEPHAWWSERRVDIDALP